VSGIVLPRVARRSAALGLAVRAAVVWLVLMLLVAVLADLLRPYSITAIDLGHRLAPPLGFGGTFAHPLGTDELGRDVLSRLIVSTRVSLLLAFGATLLGLLLGATLGLLAAHLGGLAEQAVLMLVDFQAALPFMILALAVLAFFGDSLPILAGLMSFYGWERHARVARGLALAAGAQNYVAAVRGLGAGPWRIYWGHVLPNIAATLVVSATLAFPEVILLESGLSFLGLGVQPPMSSLGNMVGYGRNYIEGAPWILLAPSIAIVLTTLAISIVGDTLRDRLDPTTSRV